jgi:orotidine-5'-phosphate decarboxylase
VRAHERIIAALDVPGPAAAAALAARLAAHVGMYKVGLELFVAHGRGALDAVRPFGLPIFLDLKLHDIPQTVEAAARAAGFLVNAVQPDAIRLAPPLIVTEEQVHGFVADLPKALDAGLEA